MKALILFGGHGTRLRPITHSQQKQLIPVANKPILFYPIEDVIEAGAKEIGIITGPNRDQVVDTVSSVEWDSDIEFIYQGAPKGLAHTILVAEDFLGDDDFIMYLGDNIIKVGIVQHAERFRLLRPEALVLLTEVDDPQRFGVAEFDEGGRMKRLVECPFGDRTCQNRTSWTEGKAWRGSRPGWTPPESRAGQYFRFLAI